MSNPLISVIVTAYNIEQYLPRCMESLLAQTYGNLEIILVDDGSTDATPQICDAYAAQSDKVQVIHRPNGGPSAARNSGVGLAKGTYIGYVDGDDWTEPFMYETMYQAIKEHEADIAICTYRQVGEGAEEIHPTGKIVPLSRQEALELYICGHEQYHIYHSVWSKLFRREVIAEIAFPEGRKSEDIMYTTWAMTKADRSVFVDIACYNYMMDRESSIMNSRLHERRFEDEIPFWKEQMNYLQEQGFSELVPKASYQFYRKMLFYYIDFCRRKMKESEKKLVRLLKEEKAQIETVYRNDFVATGDKVRMKVFLCWPRGYYCIVNLYEKFVIPLRQRRRG